jgi:hypothetical protein
VPESPVEISTAPLFPLPVELPVPILSFPDAPTAADGELESETSPLLPPIPLPPLVIATRPPVALDELPPAIVTAPPTPPIALPATTEIAPLAPLAAAPEDM